MDTNSDFELHRQGDLWRGTFTAMANPCEVLCETDNAAAASQIVGRAAREARRIEQKFSRYRTDSVVHAINTSEGRPVEVDEETARLIDYGAALWKLSDGAFDLTSGVLRKAWRFDPQQTAPDADEVNRLMKSVGWQHVDWTSPRLTLPAGMEIDFGGIGKEYAVDRVVDDIAASHRCAVLVNFGGDLRCGGGPPRAGFWQVGIESVSHAGHAVQRVKLSEGAMATSGDTRRFVESGGRRYGHILDARTGWPAQQAARSVTVAAPTCSQAGTFSTLAMLMGPDAEAFLEAEGVKFWCLR